MSILNFVFVINSDNVDCFGFLLVRYPVNDEGMFDVSDDFSIFDGS